MGDFLGSATLGRVLEDVRIHYYDIGARGAAKNDLLPVAASTDIVLFEPDPAALTGDRSMPWRSVRYVDVALAGETGTRELYVTRRGGTSSMLAADRDLAAEFGRADYFDVVNVLRLETMRLDDVVSERQLPAPTFIKIDIEGLELEVLEASPRSLDALVGLRVEVAFERLYKHQPLFHDVHAFMYEAGFRLMKFVEMHHWRRTTRRKYPNLASGLIPYSRGQLIHGDALYLRPPQTIDDGNVTRVDRRLRAAFVSMCLEHVDHARALLADDEVERQLAKRWAIRNVQQELDQVSRNLLRAARRREVRRLGRMARAQLRHACAGWGSR